MINQKLCIVVACVYSVWWFHEVSDCVLISLTPGLKTVILELPRTTPNASNSAFRNITQRLVDAISKPVSCLNAIGGMC